MQTVKKTTNNFLLAEGKLKSSSVIHLLISSSFGLNAVFFAAWLGYAIGIWSLIIQLAWSISFFLLIPASKYFSQIESLHDFLGQRFGIVTRIFAAICSLIGINYLIAWEVSIDSSVIMPLLPVDGYFLNSTLITTSLIFFATLITIWYTSFFGLKGNAFVDKILNFAKILILLLICGVAFIYFLKFPTSVIVNSIFPPFDKVILNLGIMGFITNIIFSLTWQFVDNSSWQSIIGGSKISRMSTSKSLKYSGFYIFLVVNLLATFLGISLSAINNVSPDNILSIVAGLMPIYKEIISIGIIFLSIFSLMSLIDGMLLASSSIISLDIFPNIKILSKLINNFDKVARLTVIIFGFISIWGIQYIFKLLNLNLFDLVYIVIVSQLSLIGPVIIGIFSKRKNIKFMWLSILAGLIMGFGASIVGGALGNKILTDGAGTFSVISSLAVSLFLLLL